MYLVCVVFGTAIPTSLYIFGKCFSYLYIYICSCVRYTPSFGSLLIAKAFCAEGTSVSWVGIHKLLMKYKQTGRTWRYAACERVWLVRLHWQRTTDESNRECQGHCRGADERGLQNNGERASKAP